MRRAAWAVLGLLAEVAILGWMHQEPSGPWKGVSPSAPSGPWRGVSPQEIVLLEERRIIGLAHLENTNDRGGAGKAAAEFAAIRKELPSVGLGYLNGSVALLKQGGNDLPEASALARRAAELMPRSALPHLVLAQISAREGKLDPDHSALREALRLEPNNPRVLGAMIAAFDRRRRDPPIELWRRLSAIVPDNLAVQTALLLAQVRAHDEEAALTTVKTVRRLVRSRDDDYSRRLAGLETAIRRRQRDADLRALIFMNVTKSHPGYHAGSNAVFAFNDPTAGLALRDWDVPPTRSPEPNLPRATIRWTEIAGASSVRGVTTGGAVPLALGDVTPRPRMIPWSPEGSPPILEAPDLLAGVEPAALLTAGAGGYSGKLPDPGPPASLMLADLNNDFGLDLYVVRESGDEQWVNNSARSWTDKGYLIKTAGSASLRRASLRHPPRGAGTATAVDLDLDGHLDLLRTQSSGSPAVRLLRNNGVSGFSDLTASCGLSLTGPGARRAVAADFDSDGDPDVFVARPDAGCELYLNLRENQLERANSEWGVPDSQGAMCAAVGDPDRDGDWDLAVVGYAPHGARLHRNEGGRFHADARALPLQSGAPFEWVEFVDFDNDAWVDLVCAGPAGVRLLRNDRGRWRDTGLALAADCRWVMAIDFDRDGDSDLVAVDRGNRIRLLRNEGASARPSLRLELQGFTHTQSDQANNSYGIGATVEVLTPWDQYRVLVDRPDLLLPLGRAGRAAAVRVTWPSGARQNLIRPRTGSAEAACQIIQGW